MIAAHGVSVNFDGTPLFDEATVKFLPGNCYGLIGANGAGKSTFLKVLSGELEPSTGQVEITHGLRMTKLEQDQFKYDELTALETVFCGFARLRDVMREREALYATPDFSEADGIRAGELEGEFAEMGGYEAEADAATMLSGLGVSTALHDRRMGDLESGIKVRVLLAQAMFGKPDILLLDEPTNHLDVATVTWLEDYLGRLESLVIVVSHDRHFLNNVCTHIADIDFRKINVYVGNYDFWVQASELSLQQRRDRQRKDSDKAKDLKTFIARFSSNASKARQATSRKKLLEKLTLDQLPQSTRKYPHIAFQPNREPGKSVLRVENLSASVDGEVLFSNVSFNVDREDKIAFIGPDDRARTALFRILMGELEPDGGEFVWGTTITTAFFPGENESFFNDVELNLVDWLRQFSVDQFDEDLRSYLGRMLFSGEDGLKAAKVLSGGERVRCMLSRMMLTGANVLLFDEPTNHLDLESITALNRGMSDFKGVVMFSTHDRELVNTVGTRIIELAPKGMIDRQATYDEYLENPSVSEERAELLG